VDEIAMSNMDMRAGPGAQRLDLCMLHVKERKKERKREKERAREKERER
jgi:hypothetical protein